MGFVSALVTLVVGVTLVAEELVNALAATANVLSVGGDLPVKVVNTVVTLLNVVVGFGLALGTLVGFYTYSCCCCWYIQCRCHGCSVVLSVRHWSVVCSHLRRETCISGGASAYSTPFKTLKNSADYGFVLLPH